VFGFIVLSKYIQSIIFIIYIQYSLFYQKKVEYNNNLLNKDKIKIKK